MTEYSKKCKNDWTKSDIKAINLAIDLAIDSRIRTIGEFMYTVCTVCPYRCDSSNFCWDSYIRSRYENKGQSYKNIMKALIEAFYRDTRVSTFNFFRTRVCKACGCDCKQVYLGTACTEKYLNQLRNETPMNNNYNKCTPYSIPKKSTFPLVSFSGDKMSEIINRLWKQNDNTNSKKRTNTT